MDCSADFESGHNICNVKIKQKKNNIFPGKDKLVNGTYLVDEFSWYSDTPVGYTEYDYFSTPNIPVSAPFSAKRNYKGEDYPDNYDVITALELDLYPNNNGIAQVTGIYYSYIFDIYEKIKTKATIINEVQDIYKYNPEINISRIKIEEGKTDYYIGDPITNGKKIFLDAPPGYALNGISYIIKQLESRCDVKYKHTYNPKAVTDNCESTISPQSTVTPEPISTNELKSVTLKYELPINAPVDKLVLRFSSVFEENKPYYYSAVINGRVIKGYENELSNDDMNTIDLSRLPNLLIPTLKIDKNNRTICRVIPYGCNEDIAFKMNGMCCGDGEYNNYTISDYQQYGRPSNGPNKYPVNFLCKVYPDSKHQFIQNLTFSFLPRFDPENLKAWQEILDAAIRGAVLASIGGTLTGAALAIAVAGGPVGVAIASGLLVAEWVGLGLYGAISDWIENGFDPENFFKLLAMGPVDDIVDSLKCCHKNWVKENTFGFKGFENFDTLTIDTSNPDNMYKWIRDIDYLKSCDTNIENLYDKATVEYIYAKFVKNYFVTINNYNKAFPSQACKNEILNPYCIPRLTNGSIDKQLLVQRLPEKRCGLYCAFSDVDCDSGITSYCEAVPSESISTTKPKDVDEADLQPTYITKQFEYIPAYYTEVNFNDLKRSINLPIINSMMYNNICGCLIKEESSHFKQIKEFFNSILNRLSYELITKPNKSEAINKEIELVNKKKVEAGLYDIVDTLKNTIKNRVKDTLLDKIIKNNSINIECSLSSCANSPYKLKNYNGRNMKDTVCGLEESCIGNGYMIGQQNPDGTRFNCNTVKSLDREDCVQPLEPYLYLVPNPKNFLSCRNIYKPQFLYSDKIEPSYCVLNPKGRKVGCARKNYAKVVYDILIPQYPSDPSLCPPPGESNQGIQLDIAGCKDYTSSASNKPNYTMIIVIIFFIYIFYRYRIK